MATTAAALVGAREPDRAGGRSADALDVAEEGGGRPEEAALPREKAPEPSSPRPRSADELGDDGRRRDGEGGRGWSSERGGLGLEHGVEHDQGFEEEGERGFELGYDRAVETLPTKLTPAPESSSGDDEHSGTWSCTSESEEYGSKDKLDRLEAGGGGGGEIGEGEGEGAEEGGGDIEAAMDSFHDDEPPRRASVRFAPELTSVRPVDTVERALEDSSSSSFAPPPRRPLPKRSSSKRLSRKEASLKHISKKVSLTAQRYSKDAKSVWEMRNIDMSKLDQELSEHGQHKLRHYVCCLAFAVVAGGLLWFLLKQN